MCDCKNAWSTVVECPEVQNGCVNCNSDSKGNWCIVENGSCVNVERDDEGTSYGKSYCDSNTILILCGYHKPFTRYIQ